MEAGGFITARLLHPVREHCSSSVATTVYYSDNYILLSVSGLFPYPILFLYI